ncbi:hypothetical protein BOTBODRAFT_189412 [Botryobasidium botryosum FD-172 SS1]|uniref:Uncharacterized protein n=1 Tax=Botryobasidium botryosum (strain FD-172 SS1) TaxID=930990 RepID=A0A067MJS8_BOTB1|nr:hypothetical protein BOTBODRAFT_189412 [Botryobasidium botryosum FD-172 SS1]
MDKGAFGDEPARAAAVEAWVEKTERLAHVVEHHNAAAAAAAAASQQLWASDPSLPLSGVGSCSSKEVFVRVEEHLKRVRAMEAQLRTSRELLQNSCGRSQPLASINRLPPSCLSLIFEMGAEDGRADQVGSFDASSGRGASYAFCVSQVCRHWRIVALSAPRIWARIQIRIDGRTFGSTLQALHYRTSICLERSRDYPLHISFVSERDKEESVETGPLKRALHPLQSHFIRCRELNIVVDMRNEMWSAIAAMFTHTARPRGLEGLALVASDPTLLLEGGHHRLEILFGVTQNIRYLRLESVILNRDQTSRQHGGGRLESDKFDALLRNCHSLEHLYLDSISYVDDPTDVLLPDNGPSTPISMNSLQKLTVRSVEHNVLFDFVEVVTAPALCSLEVDGLDSYELEEDDLSADAAEKLSMFLGLKSPWKVRDWDVERAVHPIIHLLRKVSTFTTLRFSNTYGVDGIVKALDLDHLCPELQTLGIDASAYGCDDATMCEHLRGLVRSGVDSEGLGKRKPLQQLRVRGVWFDGKDSTWLLKHVPEFFGVY